MTFENMKTIILTILVFISTFLTWSIWTYQPNYEALEKGKTVPGVLISKEKKLPEIIKPDMMIHHSENGHYGTVHNDEIDHLLKEMRQWTFSHFENVTAQVDHLNQWMYEKDSLEIIFPAEIPLDFYKKIIQVEDKDTKSIEFDKILIDFGLLSQEYGTVYFISTRKGQVYKSFVPSTFIQSIKEKNHDTVSENKHYEKYVLTPLNNERNLLLPDGRQKMSIQNYLIDVIPPEKFRDALFKDPNFVRRNVTLSGEEYTSSSTLLSVNDDKHLVLFVNAAQESVRSGDKKQLLEQSILFLNGHGGLTGNYRYVDIKEKEHMVLYRLYHSDGYPIFNENGISEIYQVWGPSDINKYLRNNFSLGRLLESTEIELISGSEAIKLLQEMETIEMEFIQDMRIGYDLSREIDGPLIQLKPSWFYKYNDEWRALPSSIRGE